EPRQQRVGQHDTARASEPYHRRVRAPTAATEVERHYLGERRPGRSEEGPDARGERRILHLPHAEEQRQHEVGKDEGERERGGRGEAREAEPPPRSEQRQARVERERTQRS